MIPVEVIVSVNFSSHRNKFEASDICKVRNAENILLPNLEIITAITKYGFPPYCAETVSHVKAKNSIRTQGAR